VLASFKVLITGHGTVVNGKWIAVKKYRYRNFPITGKYPDIPKPNARFWLLRNALLPAPV
jgi:hypothetical protein